MMPVHPAQIPTTKLSQPSEKKHMHAKGHPPHASVSALPAHMVQLQPASVPLVTSQPTYAESISQSFSVNS